MSKAIEDILSVIREHEAFLITSHINPDGDSIGSQLAIYSFLSELGKKAYAINTEPVPVRYKFLPNSNVIQANTDSAHLKDIEVAIILDSANIERVGNSILAKIPQESVIINIDHHSSNENFGNYELVDSDACATGELVYNIIKHSGIPICYERAICIYTAILTDTGGFRLGNTNPEAHLISAKLISEGVKPETINKLVYDIPYKKAKLFGMALGTLEINQNSKIVWMSVTNEMYEKSQTKAEDTDGFTDYLQSIKNIEVALFFREIENGATKVSFRSMKLSQDKKPINVKDIAIEFGGGGHDFAAGCSISKPLNEAIKAVLRKVSLAVD